MTLKQTNDFYEGVKSGFGIFNDYIISCSYSGMTCKKDSYGDIRLVIIPTVLFNIKDKTRTSYNLLLRPKKNLLSWNSYNINANEFPEEILKAIGEKYYLDVRYKKEGV